MKIYIKFLLLIFLSVNCSKNSESIEIKSVQNSENDNTEQNQSTNTDNTEQNQNSNVNNDENSNSFKKIISDNYDNENFKFGATLNFYQFNSNVEDLFLREFDYLVAENSFKQSIVHPEPNLWNWSRVDAFIDFVNKNNLQMRVHGPIGPQS